MTNQKDIPMLFTSPMIVALLSGSKTQTRRLKFPKDWEQLPGRRIWVKETFLLRAAGKAIIYRADLDGIEAAGTGGLYGGWKPSILMPRKWSRITLEITKVRQERLQDISEADAIAEGAEKLVSGTSGYRAGYAVLWDSINGKVDCGSWVENPLVLVYEFRRVS